MNKGKFTGIGLGPGDPELITLKGYKALQSADIIFYPVTSLEKGKEHSFSAAILDKLDISKPCRPLLFPMKGNQAEENYRAAFESIRTEYENGKNVVFVSEGDLFFYSTFGYIFKIARNQGIPCHLIPGIPAFIAASTLGERPLVEKDTGIQVIAKPKNFDCIVEKLNQNSTIVIMKMCVLDGWYSFLKDWKSPFLYVEKVGNEDEFYTTDVEALNLRVIPYFSLLIIYPAEIN